MDIFMGLPIIAVGGFFSYMAIAASRHD